MNYFYFFNEDALDMLITIISTGLGNGENIIQFKNKARCFAIQGLVHLNNGGGIEVTLDTSVNNVTLNLYEY